MRRVVLKVGEQSIEIATAEDGAEAIIARLAEKTGYSDVMSELSRAKLEAIQATEEVLKRYGLRTEVSPSAGSSITAT